MRAPFAADMTVPGDKSLTHRAVLFGAIAEGTTVIRGPLDAADTRRSLELARAIGARVEAPAAPGAPGPRGRCDGDPRGSRDGDPRGSRHGDPRVRRDDDPTERRDEGGAVWRIEGIAGRPDAAARRAPATEPRESDCGNSGTTMRLGLGILAGLPGKWRLSGDASLSRRPMGRVTTPLRAMGARIEGPDDGSRAPLLVEGGELAAIRWRSPVASAQVKSAILLAGLSARGETEVVEPAASRDHSERMLAAFGAPVARREEAGGAVRVAVRGGARLRAQTVEIPGDISSAAFFLVAAAVVPGSRLTVRSVGVNPTRTGILDVLRAAGVPVEVARERVVCGEPVADVSVSGPERVLPFEVAGALVPRLVDEVPALAVLALAARGTSEFRDCGELRVKESDRLAALALELGRLGADVEERPDGLRVAGGTPLRGTVVDSHGDHRLAMALAVAGLLAEGPVAIRRLDCVGVSYPSFPRAFAAIGGDARPA